MQYSMYYACPIIPQVIWAASVEVDVFHPITMLHLCHDYPCVPFSLQVLDERWGRGVRACDVPDQYSLPPPPPQPPPFQGMIDAPSS